MKRSFSKGALAALFAWVAMGAGLFSAEPEKGSIGLAIVYDTSGSMASTVPGDLGKPVPKYEIANRALTAIVNRLAAYRKEHSGITLQTSLTVFEGTVAKTVVAFGDFKPEALSGWLAGFTRPQASTPLGDSLRVAAAPLLASNLAHRHVLVITDGENNVGPAPAQVIPFLRNSMVPRDTPLGFHFVAFDVAARVFDPVKKLGATVLSASNEKELGTQLSVILEQKILLEDEEPARRK